MTQLLDEEVNKTFSSCAPEIQGCYEQCLLEFAPYASPLYFAGCPSPTPLFFFPRCVLLWLALLPLWKAPNGSVQQALLTTRMRRIRWPHATIPDVHSLRSSRRNLDSPRRHLRAPPPPLPQTTTPPQYPSLHAAGVCRQGGLSGTTWTLKESLRWPSSRTGSTG